MKVNAIITTTIFIAGTSGVFAGEITGNGTPIEVNGKSICAFSGLEDAEGAGPGDVQSYGRHPLEGSGVGDDPANNAPRGLAAPGFACNPSDQEPS